MRIIASSLFTVTRISLVSNIWDGFNLVGFESHRFEYSVWKMEITNVTEYEAIAKEKLPKMVYDYYASGAEDQWTLKENRNAFSRILYVSFHVYQSFPVQSCFVIQNDEWKSLFHWHRFRPRILIDVSKIDMSTTVLGFKISMPIMIAPTAMQKMAHPEGKNFLIPMSSKLCMLGITILLNGMILSTLWGLPPNKVHHRASPEVYVASNKVHHLFDTWIPFWLYLRG